MIHKVERNIVIVIIAIMLVILVFGIFQLIQENKSPIWNGYYKLEEYRTENGFQDYTDYCKYFYTEKDDEKFINSKQYHVVENNNIENIASYFDNFKKQMENQNRLSEYDFDISLINSGDYVHIKADKKNDLNYYSYSIYFYDIEAHILYYIHHNI